MSMDIQVLLGDISGVPGYRPDAKESDRLASY